MQNEVLSITQINEYIRRRIDGDPFLSSVAARGEISNYKVYPSGHHYFTIKDEGASLKCVMFRGNAQRLKFSPQNGMKIIAVGSINVYPRDGAYQLYCTGLIIDGIGDLYAAFEQLKAKLQNMGLFDSAHKKPLPVFPERIAIITSPAGAAVHDILRILNKRFPLTKAILLPVRVQGDEAPAEITNAIRYANYHQLADLLIVGRGGGSIEDLWAFNDEQVAKAIYESKIPVISAVGHEPDVTISDFVADVRAATPSNAAELAVPDQDALRQELDTAFSRMQSILLRKLKASREHLNILSSSSALRSATGYIDKKRTFLQLYSKLLISNYNKSANQKKQNFVSLTAKLDAMSPLKVLARGYSIAQSDDGEILSSINHFSNGVIFRLTVSDGDIYALVTDRGEHK